jgi:hypothetical protein
MKYFLFVLMTLVVVAGCEPGRNKVFTSVDPNQNGTHSGVACLADGTCPLNLPICRSDRQCVDKLLPGQAQADPCDFCTKDQVCKNKVCTDKVVEPVIDPKICDDNKDVQGILGEWIRVNWGDVMTILSTPDVEVCEITMENGFFNYFENVPFTGLPLCRTIPEEPGYEQCVEYNPTADFNGMVQPVLYLKDNEGDVATYVRTW